VCSLFSSSLPKVGLCFEQVKFGTPIALVNVEQCKSSAPSERASQPYSSRKAAKSGSISTCFWATLEGSEKLLTDKYVPEGANTAGALDFSRRRKLWVNRKKETSPEGATEILLRQSAGAVFFRPCCGLLGVAGYGRKKLRGKPSA